ncbi:MAG: hypothetical protein ACRCS6_08160 [Turicibacter sp.]
MKKIIISKSIIAVLIAPVLFSGTAHAKSIENFADSLDFNGKITDTASHWSWIIPESAKAAARDWSFDVAEGIEKDGHVHFTKKDLYIQYLHGHTIKEYMEGGPSLIPKISINGVPDPADDSYHGHDISVQSEGDNVGTLSFITITGASAALPGPDKLYVLYNDGRAMSLRASQSIEALSSEIAKKYGLTSRALVEKDWRKIFSQVVSPKTSHVLLAAESEMSGFDLSFPKGKIPSKWSAHVPVTVTFA